MGTDGNLSLFTPTQNRYWTSNIAGSSQSRLVLEDDRNLVIYRMDNRPAWASNTSLSPAPTATMDTLNAGQKLAPGQKLVSANGRYSLVYQGDGNLVLYDENLKSIWSATFARQSAGECVMEADGNLCLYSSARTLYWSTRLSQSGQNRLVLQDNRNLVIFRSDNTPVWASNTAL